jgi:hypothetical protein
MTQQSEVTRLRAALVRITAVPETRNVTGLGECKKIARQALGSQSTKKISKRGPTPALVVFDEMQDRF